MWLANTLTLSRIPLAAVFWASYGRVVWSLAILALAAITDALDGRAARRARRRAHISRRVATAGEWLDPVADKVFVVVVLAAIVAHGAAPAAVVLAIAARELVIVPLGLAYRIALVARPHVDHAFQADALGKVTTVLQLFAVTAIVARVPAAIVIPLAVTTGVLGLAAAARYVVRATAAPRAAA